VYITRVFAMRGYLHCDACNRWYSYIHMARKERRGMFCF